MSTIRLSIVVISVVILVSGCSTPYGEMGLLGGVEATQIDSTTMRINARGNAWTDKARIEDYVLLRAAEETLQHGFSAFEIVSNEDTSRSGTYSIPKTHYAPVFPDGPGNVEMVAYTTEHQESYYRPGDSIVIRMSNDLGPPIVHANIYSAADVISHLGYQIRNDQKAQIEPVAFSPAPSQVPVIQAPIIVPQSPRPCTADEKSIAKWARENGYHYSSTCN